MNGIEAPTENLHSNLARYLRGGPIKNVRLVAWDGARVTFTRRARRESDGAPWAPADDLARRRLSPALLLHVPVPQTRSCGRMGCPIPATRRPWLSRRAELGQPLMEAPAALDWQTVRAQLS